MNEATENPRPAPAAEREEAIVAIRPARPDGPPRGAAARPAAARNLRTALIGAVLLALLIGVFAVLPRFVADEDAGRTPAAAAAPAAVATAADGAAMPALSAAELARLEASAEDLLATLLELNEQLERRSASVWGGADWLAFGEASRAGDDAFLADDFPAANERYTTALDLGRRLLAASDRIMAAALDAGDAAIAAGNPGLAREQYGIVLTVDPDNDRALRGITRADHLPDVLGHVRDADRARADGDLAGARASYQAALAIDPDWAAAARGLAEVTTAIANARFDGRLSAGFAALAAQDFDSAAAEFTAALGLRPDSAAARDGLAEAEQGQKLDSIALAEIRALAFERRELWTQAIERYQAALATDSTLAFAIEGLARAQARADLDAKLNNLIDNPRLLLDDELLADAEAILADARAVADRGERIAAQTERLAALIAAATTPVRVQLQSDELTEVTVFRVGALGAFRQTEIEVRPGTYTVVGSRTGFRDVRRTLTVLPGRPVEPLTVVCSEPI